MESDEGLHKCRTTAFAEETRAVRFGLPKPEGGFGRGITAEESRPDTVIILVGTS
jgi:hypothetical protein